MKLKSKFHKKFPKNPLIILPLFLAFGVPLVFFLLLRGFEFLDFSKDEGVCTEDVIAETSEARRTNNKSELMEIVGKIKKLDGHEKDINCVYILLEHSIDASDSVASRKYIDLLVELDKEGETYSSEFDPRPRGSQDLVPIVEFLEEQSKGIPEGAFFGEDGFDATSE